MIRTQIQLTEAQARRVRAAAEREGVSMAEMIRRCVDTSLEEQEHDLAQAWERAMSAVGSVTDREGARDVAERHDDYLDEIYAKKLERT